MKKYWCVEDGEFFTIKAKNMDHAREQASLWNAQVVKEIENSEDGT